MLSLIAVFVTNTSLAQHPDNLDSAQILIQGTVIDSITNKPLAYVTIVLQDVTTKQVEKHILSTETGDFEVTGLAVKPYLLTLSFVGYKTKTITLRSFTNSILNLGKLYLSPTSTQLKEVQVTAPRQMLEQDADKITYNVDADPEQYSLNSLEMLRKVPRISVDADDNLLLNGKDNYQVLVNGQKSSLISGNLRDVFKNLPASSVKKIEISTAPSSRYEAEGIGGIINIITHKKSISGYNGSLNLSASTPKGYNVGGNISASIGKFGASGSYRNSYSQNPETNSNLVRNDFVNKTLLEQTTESNNTNRTQYLNSELTYQLNAQHSLTANYGRNQNSNTTNYLQKATQFDKESALTEAYNTINSGDNDGKGYDASINYQFSSSKNEQQLLSIALNMVDNTDNSTDSYTLQPILNYIEKESITSNSDDRREYAVQADYVQPLGKQTLELGIKSVFEQNNSNYLYQNKDPETGSFILDTTLRNNFGYKQDIHAAYISLNLKYKNWGLRSGLRAEETRLTADFTSSDTKAKQAYQNFFPGFILSRTFKAGSGLKLSYNQRIQRPNLYFLNPSVDNTDPLNIFFGNPDLRPATSHAFQLDFDTFFGNSFLNASVSHSFTHNDIQEFTVIGSDSVARTTYANIGRSQNSTLSLSGHTILFKKLTVSINSGANYVKHFGHSESIAQNSQGFMYYTQANAVYRHKTLRVSGNLSYNSPNVLLQGKTGGSMWSSLSFSKDFLKNNKVNISLLIKSPLQAKRKYTNEMRNTAFSQTRESQVTIRQVSLSFNYRFGKLN